MSVLSMFRHRRVPSPISVMCRGVDYRRAQSEGWLLFTFSRSPYVSGYGSLRFTVDCVDGLKVLVIALLYLAKKLTTFNGRVNS